MNVASIVALTLCVCIGLGVFFRDAMTLRDCGSHGAITLMSGAKIKCEVIKESK